jgi:hypothetical protein
MRRSIFHLMKIQKNVRAIFGIYVMAFFIIPFSTSAQYRVVGYYPGWMKTKLPANKVLFQNLTHINHAFA